MSKEKQSKKALELCKDAIICMNNRQKVFHKLNDEKQFMSYKNKMIQDNVIYFHTILPILFDNIINEYDFPLKDYLQDIVELPKQKRLLN